MIDSLNISVPGSRRRHAGTKATGLIVQAFQALARVADVDADAVRTRAA
jgi:hypothetical protein